MLTIQCFYFHCFYYCIMGLLILAFLSLLFPDLRGHPHGSPKLPFLKRKTVKDLILPLKPKPQEENLESN